MATVDYAAKAATARRLLAKFGQTAHIRRTTTSGGSPSTGGGTATTVDTPALLVVLPVDGKDVDGTLIKAGDWWVYVEALGIDPTTTDKIVCSEGVLTVIDPRKIAPAGETVLWQIIARKG